MTAYIIKITACALLLYAIYVIKHAPFQTDISVVQPCFFSCRTIRNNDCKCAAVVCKRCNFLYRI